MKRSSIIWFIVVFLFINLIGMYIAGGFYETTVREKAFTNFVALLFGILMVAGNEIKWKQ